MRCFLRTSLDRFVLLGAAVVAVACSADEGGEVAGRDGGARPDAKPPSSVEPLPSRDGGFLPRERDASVAMEASRTDGPSAPPDARAPPDGGRPPHPVNDAGLAPDSGTERDGGFACHGAGARFATGSPEHEFGPGQNLGQDLFPAPVLGPPKGGGACQGSTDVVSLGNGGFVALEFAGNAIVDGPGPDFIVFENAFGISCNTANVFAELGTVSVSDDGVTWTAFPCTATAAPYGQCSGWHIVEANADTNDIDPTDPAVAGGDAYDLADIGVSRARYVRVDDRADLTGMAGVYDLDAVAIVHPACP
jgi:hypothetical protein